MADRGVHLVDGAVRRRRPAGGRRRLPGGAPGRLVGRRRRGASELLDRERLPASRPLQVAGVRGLSGARRAVRSRRIEVRDPGQQARTDGPCRHGAGAGGCTEEISRPRPPSPCGPGDSSVCVLAACPTETSSGGSASGCSASRTSAGVVMRFGTDALPLTPAAPWAKAAVYRCPLAGWWGCRLRGCSDAVRGPRRDRSPVPRRPGPGGEAAGATPDT